MTPDLASLPGELLAYIALFLNSRQDAAAFSYTCKALHRVGQDRMARMGGSQHLLCNWAIKTGNVQLLREILAAGKVRGDMKLLCFACKHGHLAIVNELLQINNIYEKLTTFPRYGKVHPLYHASRHGHLDIVHRLLELPNTDPNKFNGVHRRTALGGAALQTNPEIVRALLNSGGRLQFSDSSHPPLYIAVSLGHTEVAEALFEGECRTKSKPEDWEDLITSFIRYTGTGEKPAVDEFLFKRLAPRCPTAALKSAAMQGRTHLLEPLLQQNPSAMLQIAPTILCDLYTIILGYWYATRICSLLIEHGAVVTETGNPSMPTPTHYAVASDNLDAVAFFYHMNLDTGPPHKHYKNLLHRAQSQGVFEFLLQQTQSVDSVDDEGYTALLHRIRHWNRHRYLEKTLLNSVKFLLESGSDPNFIAPDGTSPLFHTISERCGMVAPELVKLLTDYGAEVKDPVNSIQQRNYPMNFLQILPAGNRSRAAALLLDHGAKLHFTDRRGWTPIMYAAYCRDVDLLQLFIKRGADVFQKDQQQYTLLAILAISYEHWRRPDGSLNETLACMQLLIDAGVNPDEPTIDGRRPIDITENEYEKDFYLRYDEDLRVPKRRR